MSPRLFRDANHRLRTPSTRTQRNVVTAHKTGSSGSLRPSLRPFKSWRPGTFYEPGTVLVTEGSRVAETPAPPGGPLGGVDAEVDPCDPTWRVPRAPDGG